VHRRGSSLSEISLLGLALSDTLGEDGGVLVSSILGSLSVAALECDTMTFVLKTLRGNQSLDLRCLGVWLLSFTLWLNLTTDNELADIIFLGEAEELSDLRGALGTKTLGMNNISDAGDIIIALLDDREGEDR